MNSFQWWNLNSMLLFAQVESLDIFYLFLSFLSLLNPLSFSLRFPLSHSILLSLSKSLLLSFPLLTSPLPFLLHTTLNPATFCLTPTSLTILSHSRTIAISFSISLSLPLTLSLSLPLSIFFPLFLLQRTTCC